MKDDKKKQQENLEKEIDVQEEKVNSELEELNTKIEEFESKYKRAIADYQNLQKRVQEEKSEWIRVSNKDLLLRLLPVLDTLEMADKHLQDQGLKVSINHFLDIIKAEGVTRIKTVGENFNPHLMECLVTEPGEEGKVLEEIRAGYMLYDKVLRVAQVKVGRRV